jgi:hypothetical protein
MSSEAIVSRLRSFLLVMAALSLLVILIELWLEEHAQEPLQLIPFVLCGAGLIALVAALVRPAKPMLLALRAVMVVVALGGLLGTGVHLWKNFTFEQEVRPNEAIGEMVMNAFKGASPLLAPGAMVFAGLLAIAATYYHPVLRERGES